MSQPIRLSRFSRSAAGAGPSRSGTTCRRQAVGGWLRTTGLPRVRRGYGTRRRRPLFRSAVRYTISLRNLPQRRDRGRTTVPSRRIVATGSGQAAGRTVQQRQTYRLHSSRPQAGASGHRSPEAEGRRFDPALITQLAVAVGQLRAEAPVRGPRHPRASEIRSRASEMRCR